MNAKSKLSKPRCEHARRGGPRRRRALAAALLLVGGALSLPAAAQPRVGQGSLLVASDDIDDASWSETVVLVLHHDSNGTLGVAINRPTEVRLEEIVPDLDSVPSFTGGIFRGGPVRPTQLVFLVRNPPPDLLRNAPRILEGVYASGDLAALPEIVQAAEGTDTDMLRLYAGHVEWAPGELEREIRDERWTVANGSLDRVFSPNPALLWQRLRNAEGELLVKGPADETRPVESIAKPALNGIAKPARDAAGLALEPVARATLAALNRTPRPGPAASTDPR